MAITNIDSVIAGMRPPVYFSKGATGVNIAGRPCCLWGLSGNPGAGSYDTTLNGVTLSSTSSLVDGQFYWQDPTGGENAYLARFGGNASVAGTLLLCDRLWHNGGYDITSTSAQTSTTPTWPARDADGSTNGNGVLLGLEISATTGAGTPTITIGYTNSAGTASRTATNTYSTSATSTARALYPIGLQSGDHGVRSVQSLTLSTTWTSGTINLVAYRVIAALDVPTFYGSNSMDVLSCGMPRMYNGSVPFLMFIPAAASTSWISGHVMFTHG